MNDSSVKCVDWKQNKGLYTLYGMAIQNQMVSQEEIKHRIKRQKSQTDTMSFRLLQTNYSHTNQRL